MLRIFIGYDERQPISYTVLQQSIIAQASEPVSITPLVLKQLPLRRQGLTPFTYSRFLVPWLCSYQGIALFLDADIVLNGDIGKLFDAEFHAPQDKAVWVSKNEHRFEWASVMLFDCGHPANAILTPEYIEKAEGLHKIEWCKEEEIGDLPREWNHLVGYDKPRNDAKLIHFTQGVPAYPETDTSEYAEVWERWHGVANSTVPWETLMGNSVHAVEVNGTKMPTYLWNLQTGAPKPEHEAKIRQLLTQAS